MNEELRKAQGARLRAARIQAGFPSASAAAKGVWPISTYSAHERGTRTIGMDDAERYARRFRAMGVPIVAQSILFGEGAGEASKGQAGLALPKVHTTLPLYVSSTDNDGGYFTLSDRRFSELQVPPALARVPEAYALVVPGHTMEPRYMPGEIVFIHPTIPPSPSDFVVVQIAIEPDAAPAVYVKRFVSMNARELVLDQLNPPERRRIPAETVKAIHKIVASSISQTDD